METAHILGEVLKYVAPAALLILAWKFWHDAHAVREQRSLAAEHQRAMLKQHMPLKLNAYERAVLFLERITPMSLIPRLGNGAGRSAEQFHQELIQEIRSEFEHNLSQQIYISHQGWAVLVHAKEEVINLINAAAREMDEEHSGIDLSKKIVEKISQTEILPTHKATFVLKSDVHKLFEA